MVDNYILLNRKINLNIFSSEFYNLRIGLSSNKILTKRVILNVIKRNMFSRAGMLAKNVMQHASGIQKVNTNSVLYNVPSNNRGMASVHGGTFKKPANVPKVSASADNLPVIISDVTGAHKVAVVASCNNIKCKHVNCSSKEFQPNPCEIPTEDHQKSLKELVATHTKIVCEFGGAMTHKLPQGFSGVALSEVDANNNLQKQYIVKEEGVVPVDVNNFKENMNTTAYLQQDLITAKVIDNLSRDSVLNVKDQSCSTILLNNIKAKNDGSLDEGF